MPDTPQAAPTAPVPSILTTWHAGNVPSVAIGADNNLVIPVGDNVHAVMFTFLSAVAAPLNRAQLITDVARIQLFLNGETIYDRTATEALDEYLFWHNKNVGLAAPLGCIVVDCMNYGLDIWDQRRGAALGMLKTSGKPGQGPYNTLSYRVLMTGAVATAAACEIHVVTDLNPQEPTGVHIRRLRTTRDLAAIGDNFVADLPRAALGLLNLRVTDVNITRIDVEADARFIYRDLEWNTLQVLMHQAQLSPQVATYTDVPFCLGRDLWSFLPYTGLSRLRFNFFAGAVAPGAGTVICTEEVWDHVRE